MPTPVVEQIAQKIETRLATVADSTVVRPARLNGITPATGLIVLTQGNPSPDDELFQPGNPPAIAWVQPFVMGMFNRASDKDETPVDQYLNALWAAVVVAICTPAATWHEWDGLAVISKWAPHEGWDSDEIGVSIVTLRLDVTYRTDEGNPNTTR